MIARSLDIGMLIHEDGMIELTVTEPESGCDTKFEFNYSPDEHPEFDAKIGNELYFWISTAMEYMKE